MASLCLNTSRSYKKPVRTSSFSSKVSYVLRPPVPEETTQLFEVLLRFFRFSMFFFSHFLGSSGLLFFKCWTSPNIFLECFTFRGVFSIIYFEGNEEETSTCHCRFRVLG